MSRGQIGFVGPDGWAPEVRAALERKGFRTTLGGTIDAVVRPLPDAVAVDIDHVPDLRAFCERAARVVPHLPVLVWGPETLDEVVASMRAGAYDYLTRPIRVEALAIALDRAVEHSRLRAELGRLRHAVSVEEDFEGLIGASAPMQRLFSLLERVAESDASVLVQGETGSGKELVARAIHRRGRGQSPFVAVNCAAVPEQLLESELFGHVRGAFTDARSPRTGLFTRAGQGTLFLDEIGDMPLGLQPKLLRVLQERRFRPVGGDDEVPFHARVIAATNRDLDALVGDGRFREDLYYRIQVIQLDLPPLRDRGTDVLQLAEHFVTLFAARAGRTLDGLSPDAARFLLRYRWPGNVRELANVLERAVALSQSQRIEAEDLPARVVAWREPRGATPSTPDLLPLATVEERHIRQVLDAVGGNRTVASRILGLDRKTLYRRLQAYGMGASTEAD